MFSISAWVFGKNVHRDTFLGKDGIFGESIQSGDGEMFVHRGKEELIL